MKVVLDIGSKGCGEGRSRRDERERGQVEAKAEKKNKLDREKEGKEAQGEGDSPVSGNGYIYAPYFAKPLPTPSHDLVGCKPLRRPLKL